MARQYMALRLCVKDQARKSMIIMGNVGFGCTLWLIPCEISAMPVDAGPHIGCERPGARQRAGGPPRHLVLTPPGSSPDSKLSTTRQGWTGNGPDCLISERLKLDSRFDTPG